MKMLLADRNSEGWELPRHSSGLAEEPRASHVRERPELEKRVSKQVKKADSNQGNQSNQSFFVVNSDVDRHLPWSECRDTWSTPRPRETASCGGAAPSQSAAETATTTSFLCFLLAKFRSDFVEK